ncbi:hypothetical protein GHB53_14955, partial [Enterococcus faecium]|nr:hypothetical protein [Enterococcus faecium]
TGSTSLMLFLNFELANNKRNNTKKETLTNIVLFCEHYNRLSEEKILLPENWAELRKLVEYGII